MLNVLCRLTCRIYHYENFPTLKHSYLLDSLLFFYEILEFDSSWYALQTLRISEKKACAPLSYGRLNDVFNLTLACHVIKCIKRVRL